MRRAAYKGKSGTLRPPALAKISRPALAEVYPRKRLFRLLDRARRQPVIWVASPAGAGKTTLVASYLADHQLPALWYRADEGDGDGASFFYYMGLAAARAAPRRRPLPFLTPEYRAGLPTFARNYFRALLACLPRPAMLVLDNYQDVPEDGILHQLLPHGLDEVDAQLSVVIISRAEPPASFARLAASGSLAMLGWDALQLAESETLGIARLRLGKKRPADMPLAAFHGEAGGWVAGLVLLLERARAADAARRALGKKPGQGAIFDYFASEVFRHTDAATQSFLLKTALLPRVSVACAKELAPGSDAERVLDGLTRRNFFTVRHQGSADTFEYHPLFRDFLVALAAERYAPDELNALRRQCAELLARDGDREAAVAMLQQAEDWPAAARLMLAQAGPLVAQGRLQTLLAWLNGVPAALRDGNPEILYWLGVCRLPFDPRDARKYFVSAFALLERADESALRHLAWSGIVDSFVAEGNDYGALDPWLDAFPALAQNRAPPPEIAATAIFSYVSGLFHRRSDDPQLPVYAARAESLLLDEPDAARWRGRSGPLIYYYLWKGDIAKAELLLQRLAPAVGTGESDAGIRITGCLLQSFHACLTRAPEECVRLAEEGLALARKSGVHVADQLLLGRCVYGHLLGGNVAAARAMAQQMLPALGRARLHDALYNHLASVISLRDGQKTRALQEAGRAVDWAKASGWRFAEAMALVVAASVAASCGESEAALRDIAAARAIGVRMESALCAYLCAFAEASVRRLRGEDARALVALAEALRLGQAMGMQNPPWFMREEAAALYGLAVEQHLNEDYVETTIRRLRLRPPGTRPERWPWPIRIYTLGRFEVTRFDAPIAFSGKAQRKPLGLLRLLLAQGSAGASSARLIEMLWPDSDGDLAQRSFDVTVHRLRKLLGVEGSVILRDGHLALDPGSCWVDAWALERLLQPAEPAPADALMEKVLALYQGAFLAGDDTPSLLPLREQLQSKFLRAALRHAQALEHQAQGEAALAWYQKALEVDPLAEEVYRRQMASLLRLGRPAEALAVYQRCRRVLRSLLSAEPASETRALSRAIQQAARASGVAQPGD